MLSKYQSSFVGLEKGNKYYIYEHYNFYESSKKDLFLAKTYLWIVLPQKGLCCWFIFFLFPGFKESYEKMGSSEGLVSVSSFLAFILHMPCVMVPMGQNEHQVRSL